MDRTARSCWLSSLRIYDHGRRTTARGRSRPGLPSNPAVRAAVDFARADEKQTIADQIRICEVEAPPFQEAKRAQLYAEMFRELGLKNVRIDAEGNVIGERPGASARPNLVMSAHLDTVFPRGTNVKVRRDGYVLRGPGIGDDCRGLADLGGGCACAERGRRHDARERSRSSARSAKKGSATCEASSVCSTRH